MIQTSRGLLIVVSQGQSRSPEKRAVEEGIAQLALQLPNTASMLVPHLYDLSADSESLSRLKEWHGPIVLLTWLFDRAAFWVLDRMDVRGKFGTVELLNPDTVSDEEEDADEKEDEKAEDRVVNLQPRPNRRIYSIDMRSSSQLADYEREFQRILEQEKLHPSPQKELLSLERFLQPTNSTALSSDGSGRLDLASGHNTPLGILPLRIDEHPSRRWYPVIDYSRCTNCMECIDFCLFGVYGVDKGETILVEQPDNCRKGCPACSRVCPENAIIFPQHKTPAIAGAPVEAGTFKIDLSKLFGAPERNEDAVAAAARERDEQLILAGRQAVGIAPSMTSEDSRDPGAARERTPATDKPKDALDNLIDQLDHLDL